MQAIEIASVVFALCMAWITGNYLRIRAYLWAMLAYKLATVGYLAVGSREDAAYHWVYSLGTLGFLLAGLWVMREAVQFAPKELRHKYLFAPITCGAFLILTSASMDVPVMIMTIQAAAYAIIGIPTRASCFILERTFTYRGSMPYKVLGTYWMLQALLCLLYATGIAAGSEVWHNWGTWILAAPPIVANTVLGWSFHTTSGIPVYMRPRG